MTNDLCELRLIRVSKSSRSLYVQTIHTGSKNDSDSHCKICIAYLLKRFFDLREYWSIRRSLHCACGLTVIESKAIIGFTKSYIYYLEII